MPNSPHRRRLGSSHSNQYVVRRSTTNHNDRAWRWGRLNRFNSIPKPLVSSEPKEPRPLARSNFSESANTSSSSPNYLAICLGCILFLSSIVYLGFYITTLISPPVEQPIRTESNL